MTLVCFDMRSQARNCSPVISERLNVLRFVAVNKNAYLLCGARAISKCKYAVTYSGLFSGFREADCFDCPDSPWSKVFVTGIASDQDNDLLPVSVRRTAKPWTVASQTRARLPLGAASSASRTNGPRNAATAVFANPPAQTSGSRSGALRGGNGSGRANEKRIERPMISAELQQRIADRSAEIGGGQVLVRSIRYDVVWLCGLSLEPLKPRHPRRGFLLEIIV